MRIAHFITHGFCNEDCTHILFMAVHGFAMRIAHTYCSWHTFLAGMELAGKSICRLELTMLAWHTDEHNAGKFFKFIAHRYVLFIKHRYVLFTRHNRRVPSIFAQLQLTIAHFHMELSLTPPSGEPF